MNRAAITMLNTGGVDASPLDNTISSASGLKLTVIRANSFNKVSEVEKALRNITGVDNVTIGDYNSNSRIATINVATRLSAQELVVNIRNIKLPKLEVVEVSSREIKLAMR
jgi:PKD repeat protein